MKAIHYVVLSALSCSVAGSGVPSNALTATDGPTAAEASSRLTWVDATGAVVSTGEDPLYIDGAGIIWRLDVETGGLALNARMGLFGAGDCNGKALVQGAPEPRVAFQRLPDTARWYARGDAQATRKVEALDVGCEAILGAQVVIDLPPEVAPPALSFKGPLHREMR